MMDSSVLDLNANIDTSKINDFPIGDPIPYYYPTIEKYYYNYPIYNYCNTDEKYKVEVAFRIAQKLVDKKLVNTKTIKDFIDLVNEIAKTF